MAIILQDDFGNDAGNLLLTDNSLRFGGLDDLRTVGGRSVGLFVLQRDAAGVVDGTLRPLGGFREGHVQHADIPEAKGISAINSKRSLAAMLCALN